MKHHAVHGVPDRATNFDERTNCSPSLKSYAVLVPFMSGWLIPRTQQERPFSYLFVYGQWVGVDAMPIELSPHFVFEGYSEFNS